MNCKDFLNEVSAYLDDEAGEEVRAEIEIHCNRCHKCYVLLKTCEKTIMLYRDIPLRELPSALHARLMEQIAKLPRRRPAAGK